MENKATSKWGELSPLEGTMQITGSMLNMRTPKLYRIEAKKSEKCTDILKGVREIPVCQHTRASIKIQEYINETETGDIDKNKLAKLQALIPIIPSDTRKDVSTTPQLFKSEFDSRTYDLQTSAVDGLTRKAIAAIAFKTGFSKTTSSTLNVLEHITAEYFTTICKSLKLIYENQAMTGRTAMFDAVDQVLHDHGIGGVNDLKKFYEHDVIEHGNRLIHSVKKKVEIENKISRKRGPKLPTVTIKSEAEEKPLSWTYPAPEEPLSSQWLPFVKTEPLNISQAAGGSAYNQVGKHSAYINTFRPISPQTGEEYQPNKKKMRAAGFSNS